MQSFVRPLYLLHSSDALRDRLLEAQAGAFRLARVDDWAALRQALFRSPAAVAVVDPCEPGRSGAPAAALRDLLAELPSATVLAALEVAPADGALLRTLMAWGVADVIVLGREDTPAALAHRVRAVQGLAVHRLLRRALPRGVPGRARPLLAAAAETVAAGGQAPELAAALGVNERTVPRWFERADLPPPRRLLAWLRLLLAAELLDDPGRTVAAVAQACGYANEASLKAALRQFMGAPPSELRRRGAFATGAAAFADELFRLREAARTRGRPEKAWLN
ncbi:MAG TPA: helix-turn-helix domain-containing protein [Longimicrobiaceae bacterium]|nr:helix-turn-helix domain-containing protein [Longimicrobiaceae bacterium]